MYFGFEDVTIKYGRNLVLEDVSIDFPKGKTTTIIGSNGCGKSSLLKAIPRVVIPEKGEVYFCNKPIHKYKPKELAKRIAYLPQSHQSPSDIDVKTLVSYGRYPHKKFTGGLTKKDRAVIEETIEITGLTHLSNRILTTLSGGERQRAWIAMIICQQPEVLVLDEPITYLDIGYQLEVMELIKSLGEQLNITIVMVLHDINLAARYSHYLVSIQNHHVHMQDSPRMMMNEEHLNTVFRIGAQIYEDKINKCPFIIPEKAEQSSTQFT